MSRERNLNSQNVIEKNVDDGESRIALILSKTFQLQDLAEASDMQVNIDLERVACLKIANASLRPEKQLRLYVARLQYEIPDCYGRWDQKKAVESATWYTVRGEKLGSGSPFPVTWTTSFNFLNPGKEPLGQLWKSGDGEFVCRYERLAIVGWPASADIRNTHRFMGEAAAADSVFMDEPVDLARLQMLLRYDADQGNQGVAGSPPPIAALADLNTSYAVWAREWQAGAMSKWTNCQQSTCIFGLLQEPLQGYCRVR